ncbi:zonular occludens toxin domain-containing protein [Sulfuricurvum sp.]|uniref:zonular occludens toxin domain-containing protein n=1 Tax=Sulfuricurvum sp. TaxID=2025608 RepID=UPI003563E15F
MIEFYTGVPGSGKTYRAVSYLYDIFLDSKSKSFGKFKKFYTNINEFQFDAFPAGLAFDLDYELLLVKLTQLHKLYMSKCTDTELLELAEELGLKDAFFVIDEAHNYFEKKNSVLVWWLSYHRHLHQDIILVTQNLALVESKYKSFSEFFYKAIPSSLRVFGSTLKYEQYIGSRMYKNQRSEKFTLKFNPDVYALYTSGANTQGKKVIYKYVAFAVAGLVVVIIAISLMVHFIFGGKKSSTDLKPVPVSASASSSVASHASASSIVSSSVDDSFPLVRFVCTYQECHCDGFVIPNANMTIYIKEYKLKVLTLERLPDGYFIYRYKVPKKFVEDVLND